MPATRSLPAQRVICCRRKRGHLGIDLDDDRAGSFGNGRKGSRRVDLGRRSDDEHEIATARHCLGGGECIGWQHLLEPDHVRTEQGAAAGAARNFFADQVAAFYHSAFARAFNSTDVAVQFDHLAATGTPMQTIDVLGDQQAVRDASLDIDQGVVRGIRLHFRNEVAAPRIPIPNELGVLRKCSWRRKLQRIESRP
jgi:hypothetical protein